MSAGQKPGMSKPVLFTWSGGKDSAMALWQLRQQPGYSVCALITTLTEGYDRISMHGVRRVLLEQQAAAIGLPLEKVYISQQSSTEAYESRMRELLVRHRAAGVSKVAVGDIFLEDLRKYREEKLREAGMEALFPIWGRDTTKLARQFIELGFRATLTCVDSQLLDGTFAGRAFDESLLEELPDSVDRCGENGEFHSFVHDGPIFREPLAVERGEVVLRDERFYFCDLLPADEARPGQ